MNSQTITWEVQPKHTNKLLTSFINWIKIIILILSANILLRSDTNIHLSTSGMLPSDFPAQLQSVSDAMLTSYHAPTQEKTPAYNHVPPKAKISPIVAEEEESLFLNPIEIFNESTKKPAAKVKKKRRDCKAYIKRFKGTAISEMKKYGIPASITLAQGILESNAGTSSLAEGNNNHFGMKCFSKKCAQGHCSNFHDDDHKDFFRKYNTAWESYRAHSLLLATGKRYKHLHKLKRTDYKGWAKGLQDAGYATGKQYGKKLIKLIETLDLAQYDET